MSTSSKSIKKKLYSSKDISSIMSASPSDMTFQKNETFMELIGKSGLLRFKKGNRGLIIKPSKVFQYDASGSLVGSDNVASLSVEKMTYSLSGEDMIAGYQTKKAGKRMRVEAVMGNGSPVSTAGVILADPSDPIQLDTLKLSLQFTDYQIHDNVSTLSFSFDIKEITKESSPTGGDLVEEDISEAVENIGGKDMAVFTHKRNGWSLKNEVNAIDDNGGVIGVNSVFDASGVLYEFDVSGMGSTVSLTYDPTVDLTEIQDSESALEEEDSLYLWLIGGVVSVICATTLILYFMKRAKKISTESL